MNATIRSLVLVFFAASCTGEFVPMGPDEETEEMETEDPPVDSTAREVFDLEVQPLLVARCQTCHVEGMATAPGNALKFLGANADANFYSAVNAFPSVVGGYNSGLATMINKGAHEGSGWWTPEEDEKIRNWLDMEQAARGTGGGGGPVVAGDSLEALAAWSGCMSLTNWIQADMGSWADKNAEGGTVCSSCHADGLQRFNTNGDETEMFTMNRYELFIIGFFTVSLDPESGDANIVPAIDKLERMGNGTTLHPTYSIDNEHFDRLEQFYQLTLQDQQAGGCGPATFPTSP